LTVTFPISGEIQWLFLINLWRKRGLLIIWTGADGLLHMSKSFQDSTNL
jgi:hypothetical protein